MNNRIGFNNKNNSCSFDSFITCFINSIYPLLLKNDSNINKDDLLKINDNFSLYIKFIKYIINKNIKEKIYFYDLYDMFNKENECDILIWMKVKGINLYQLLLIIEIYVIMTFFVLNIILSIIARTHVNLIESLYSTPYIDIPLEAYGDTNINNIENLFNNYIYINLNTICNYRNTL